MGADAGKSERISFSDLCSYKRLEATWLLLREDLRQEWGRDCIDFLDNDMGRQRWIQRLRGRLLMGTYRPKQPGRREEAKANGSYRVLTVPGIDDLLVYRHLCEFIHSVSRDSQAPGTYFSRRHHRDPVGKRIDDLSADDYLSFFEIWLRYNNYRKYIGLSGLYPCLVVADITNFFDSIQHPLLMEYLAPYRLPREAVGVVGQLLQALRPETGHSPSPAVGIPVDTYDCSRILANVFLFEHDRRILQNVKAESYTRFMDDHALGTESEVAARGIVRRLQQSLDRQRLALNTAKTRILNQAQVVEYFWLDENDSVDELEHQVDIRGTRADIDIRFNSLWGVLRTKTRVGQWTKIAKRLYRLAARIPTDAISLDDCKRDIVEGPLLAEHIYRYLLLRGRHSEYIDLFEWLLESGNSIYEDIEEKWFEHLLFVAPPDSVQGQLSQLAEEFCRGATRGTERPGPRVPAALLLYWLGPLNAPIVLESILLAEPASDGSRQRTVAAILCAIQPAQIDRWLALAAREPAPQVSHLIEWLARLRSNEHFVIPNPLMHRRMPLKVGKSGFEARSWLRLELLLTSMRPDLRAAVSRELGRARKRPLSALEETIAARLTSRLAHGP